METWYCYNGHKFDHPDEAFWNGKCYKCPICGAIQVKRHNAENDTLEKKVD